MTVLNSPSLSLCVLLWYDVCRFDGQASLTSSGCSRPQGSSDGEAIRDALLLNGTNFAIIDSEAVTSNSHETMYSPDPVSGAVMLTVL